MTNNNACTLLQIDINYMSKNLDWKFKIKSPDGFSVSKPEWREDSMCEIAVSRRF